MWSIALSKSFSEEVFFTLPQVGIATHLPPASARLQKKSGVAQRQSG